ncbi:MAG TPA: helix-turn-helix domain-containing protein [Gaiellales bacterium]|nr:helix-turn-helix domain-containing protein [Gaiellales bacterium]
MSATEDTQPPAGRPGSARRHRWSFLTNHAIVLLHLAEHPDVRIVEIAEHAKLSRRAAQMIVHDLVEAGYVRRSRIGRRNSYAVEGGLRLRRLPMASVQQLLALLPDRPVG